MNEKNELYRQKGELLTSIEILQAQLKAVNAKLIEILNAERQPTEPKEVV